jgi:hypothetical protein
MIQKIKNKIIDFTYVISNQPVKLQELLSANSLYNEGMHLDGKKLGFRLKLGRAYLSFLALVNIVMMPVTLATHEIFQDTDCHISILLTLFVTGTIFASFGLYKDWLSDEVALKRIKRMWNIHFPLFSYDEYSNIVDDIYKKGLNHNISKNKLERYIMDELATQ